MSTVGEIERDDNIKEGLVKKKNWSHVLLENETSERNQCSKMIKIKDNSFDCTFMRTL